MKSAGRVIAVFVGDELKFTPLLETDSSVWIFEAGEFNTCSREKGGRIVPAEFEAINECANNGRCNRHETMKPPFTFSFCSYPKVFPVNRLA